jgi:alkanesulfonate monooxygenase SsuD/methylene tetrahydromethanopterin reductase-like flavin-dependent oxidoreductase (luciferase family)
VVEIKGRLEAACEKVGRDPSTLTISVMAGILVGRDEADVAERTQRQVAIFGDDTAAAEQWLDARRDRWILGTPEAARARIAEYVDTGIDRLLFQDFLPRDLDHIAITGELIS